MKNRDLFGNSFESKESREQKFFDKAFVVGERSSKSESSNPVREGLRSHGMDYVDVGGKAIFTKYEPFGHLGNYGGLGSKSHHVGSNTGGGFVGGNNNTEIPTLMCAYLPVQGNSVGAIIARVAESELNSKNWGLLSSQLEEGQYMFRPKCNEFVADVLRKTGLSLNKPNISKWGLPAHSPTASQ